MTTNATPLSAVKTKWLLSFCRLCKVSLSCLVMLDLGNLDLLLQLENTFLTLV